MTSPKKRNVDHFEKAAHALRQYRGDKGATLSQAIAHFEAADQPARAEKRRIGRNILTELQKDEDLDKELLHRLLDCYTASDSDHPFMKNAHLFDGLRHAASLRTSLVLRTRRRVLTGATRTPEWLLQSKQSAYRFADIMGIRHPTKFPETYDASTVPFKTGTVLKPPSESASRGVYLIKSEDQITDVFRYRQISGFAALRDALAQDVAEGLVPHNQWQVEELITDSRNEGGASHDWKFYAFYGKIFRLGQIRRFPEPGENWMDGNLKSLGLVRPGVTLFDDPERAQRAPEYMKLARRISLAVPAPFLRIDLLSSETGPVVGEFTPRPGVIHMFNKDLDRGMGDYILEAQARLEQDFLNGKQFRKWKRFSGQDSPRPSVMQRVAKKVARKFFA
jgi:hypothetical protein